MRAIIKKEIVGYFASPIGYIFVALMVCWASIAFFFNVVLYGKTDMQPVFDGIFYLSFFAVPILTMRIISDEKRQKTDQVLYTAPITTTQIVMGKFWSAMTVYASSVAVVFLHMIFLAFFTGTDWGLLFCEYLGMVFVGALLISIGMFVSSFTESQLISAMVSIVISLIFIYIDSTVLVANTTQTVITAAQYVSIHQHYVSFYNGYISLTDVIFFLTTTGLFLFLTARSMDKKRWA